MVLNKKIIDIERVELAAIGDIALCYGHFNLIHPGHLRYLQYAKTLAKNLIVVIKSDKELNSESSGHHFSENERAESLANLEIVNNVVILNDYSLEELISRLKPSVLVLGKEFENQRNKEIVLAINAINKSGRVVFHAGETSYATTHLLHDNVSDIERNNIIKFQAACKSNNITCDKLQGIINNFSDLKLLVIGDTIVDNYVACDAVGMSAEAPILVVK